VIAKSIIARWLLKLSQIMKKEYLEALASPQWQKKRLEIMQRDNFTCQFCGCKDRTLHIHHKVYEKGKKPWEYEDKDLITLCDRCHEEETEMNNLVYDDYKELRDTFKRKGLSMTLLDTILTNITDAITRQDNVGECAHESTAYEYVRGCVCGTQIISDIFATKSCGFDLRDLIQKCYPSMINKYDKI
jgi:hypothetical protein